MACTYRHGAILTGLLCMAGHGTVALAQPVGALGDTIYGGVNVTYSDRSTQWDDVNAGPLGGHDASGAEFGVQAGYDKGLGPIFIGIAGKFTPDGHGGKHEDRIFSRQLGIVQHDRSREKWSAQVAGRIGTQLVGFRPYAKAGLAFSRKHYSLTGYYRAKEAFAATSSTRTGWLLGAGMERSILPGLAMFAEYTHADFGSKTERFRCLSGYPDCAASGRNVIPIRLDEKKDDLTVGFNFRF